MTHLYEDVCPPAAIEGYASVFDVTYRSGGSWQRIAPYAFDTTAYRIFAAFMHDRDRRLGWTQNKTLTVWQDDHGLAFRLAVPSNHAGLNLVVGIARHNFRGVSFSSPGDGIRTVDVVHEDGRTVEVISRLRVDEISICPAGANPDACCWLDIEEPEGLPPHVRAARDRWHAGRAQATRPRIAASARAATRPKAAA